MSTIYQHRSQIATDRFRELQQLLHVAGDAQNLLQPEQLTMRLNLLDELDALMGDLDPDLLITCPDSGLLACAGALRRQLESANQTLYQAVHAEIALRGGSPTLDRWLLDAKEVEAELLHPGLGFDLLDEIVCGVLQLHEPGEPGLLPSAEMTYYQPTPARHILDLVATCRLSSDDIFVDLGSGLGHVPLLVNILTGNRTLGVEVQQDYAASAQQTAQRLNLSGVRFVAEDARITDLSSGTVFYLFTPFTGSILTEVLHRLHQESKTRPIRVCGLGPSTRIMHEQTWLRTNQQPDTERITTFGSV